MEGRVRVGIIGATPGHGYGAQQHIPAYRKVPGIEVVAVCTAHKESAEASAKWFEVPKYYWDYHEMVQDPDIDLVCIVTAIKLHYEIAKAALEAGKHVFSEWPLTVTAADALELAELAKTKHLQTGVGFQGYFDPVNMQMRELIAEGFLGPIYTFHQPALRRANYPRPSKDAYRVARESGWGALSVTFGGAINAVRFLLGPVEAVTGDVRTQVKEWILTDTKERVEVTAPDSVAAIVRLKSGVVGTVHASNVAAFGRGGLQVFGERGKLTTRATGERAGYQGDWHLRPLDEGPGFSKNEVAAQLVDGSAEEGIPLPDRIRSRQLGAIENSWGAFNIANMMHHYTECLLDGRQITPNFASAARLHQILEAVVKSSETGKSVPLEGDEADGVME